MCTPGWIESSLPLAADLSCEARLFVIVPKVYRGGQRVFRCHLSVAHAVLPLEPASFDTRSSVPATSCCSKRDQMWRDDNSRGRYCQGNSPDPVAFTRIDGGVRLRFHCILNGLHNEATFSYPVGDLRPGRILPTRPTQEPTCHSSHFLVQTIREEPASSCLTPREQMPGVYSWGSLGNRFFFPVNPAKERVSQFVISRQCLRGIRDR